FYDAADAREESRPLILPDPTDAGAPSPLQQFGAICRDSLGPAAYPGQLKANAAKLEEWEPKWLIIRNPGLRCQNSFRHRTGRGLVGAGMHYSKSDLRQKNATKSCRGPCRHEHIRQSLAAFKCAAKGSATSLCRTLEPIATQAIAQSTNEVIHERNVGGEPTCRGNCRRRVASRRAQARRYHRRRLRRDRSGARRAARPCLHTHDATPPPAP